MFPGVNLVTIIPATLLLYTASLVVYRLWLSPIARFPGRKLAALTFWYEFYYDVVKDGSYTWEIEKMHKEFGPIIRINPLELHVKTVDLEFMSQLYPSVAKNVEKFPWFAELFGNTEMAFTTIGHNLHRLRRSAFQNFFSKASVRRLEPLLRDLVDALCEQLLKRADTGQPVNLTYAFSALTQDVITEYCYSDRRNVLGMDDFAPLYYDMVQKPAILTAIMKQYPILYTISNALPAWLLRRTSPEMALYLDWQEHMRRDIRVIMAKHASSNSKDTSKEASSPHAPSAAKPTDAALPDKSSQSPSPTPPTPPTEVSHPTIFHALLSSPDLPPPEKSLQRLAFEAQSLIGAGTLTSTHTLSTTFYHLLSNPPILTRLNTELSTHMPNPSSPLPPLSTLEKLPYLSAVVHEGLRISYGILHRLQRVHPDNELHFEKWTIPRGTAVGMSPYFVHTDPSLFPEPREFRPERWLGEEGEGRKKWIFNFGRGTRMCAGRELAMGEIFLGIAAVGKRFAGEKEGGRGGARMRLFDTERERDVDVVRDYFITFPSRESKGVRVVIESSDERRV